MKIRAEFVGLSTLGNGMPIRYNVKCWRATLILNCQDPNVTVNGVPIVLNSAMSLGDVQGPSTFVWGGCVIGNTPVMIDQVLTFGATGIFGGALQGFLMLEYIEQ